MERVERTVAGKRISKVWTTTLGRQSGRHPNNKIMSRRALIIAEIGENHGGDWQLARLMIAEAARAGADVVKFQSYFGADVADTEPEREWFTKVQLPDAVHFELMAYAEQCRVEFMSTPFRLGRTRFLVE